MAQPPAYVRQYNFQNFQQASPNTPLPANQVEIELNAVKATFDATLANLRKIQRDDGALANQSVGVDQLRPEVAVGINAAANWAPFTAYSPRNAVWNNSALYYCLTAHTSSAVFGPDIANWSVLLDLGQQAAGLSATAAAASAANAASSASTATTQAANAATLATAAANSGANASASASDAAGSASAAVAAAMAAAGSASAAAAAAGPFSLGAHGIARVGRALQWTTGDSPFIASSHDTWGLLAANAVFSINANGHLEVTF